MATASLSKDLTEGTLEPHERPGYRKLGLYNGLLIGVALALGSWGLEALRLSGVPVANAYTSLILSGLVLIALCTLTGWLTSRLANPWVTVLLWLGTGVIAALIIGYQPYISRTVSEWVADTRAWGLTIFSPDRITNTGLILGGVMIIISLTVLALVQGYRLEQAVNELNDGARMSPRAWYILLLPVPFLMIIAYFTASVQINPAAGAANVVHEAIEVARTTEGDLFQLGIEQGISYAALDGVRDQLTENYTLRIGEIDPTSSQTYILADFDNGAWINCRTINDQLSFCYDASPPYTAGLASLISGESPPEGCRGCPPQASEELTDWLQERAALLGADPQFERLGQWGGFVLMRVSSADGDYAIECLFDRMSPVQLASCEEAAN